MNFFFIGKNQIHVKRFITITYITQQIKVDFLISYNFFFSDFKKLVFDQLIYVYLRLMHKICV